MQTSLTFRWREALVQSCTRGKLQKCMTNWNEQGPAAVSDLARALAGLARLRKAMPSRRAPPAAALRSGHHAEGLPTPFGCDWEAVSSS